jgi:hypothetical protein
MDGQPGRPGRITLVTEDGTPAHGFDSFLLETRG